ncbi:MAG: hypothetical protein Q8Q11_02255 [bacterium]|nr:hypothetical protein [bacterium]MDZ4248150.1 hypothetical protein [Patescibacteria group bacterium]
MKDLFLIAAAIITVASVIPYARDILKGTTKPNIVSWLTWTILTAVATIAEFAAHEYTAALFTSSAVLETGLIVLLGLRYGYAQYSRFDAICQIGALSGFLLWWLFDSPALAVIAAVAIDFIGALPTVRHSWLKPGEETWSLYAMACIGGVLAIFALSSYNWTSLTYAVYIVFINFLIASVLILREKKILVRT